MARWLSWLTVVMCTGACSPDVNLGNDVLWSTDHESGDLSDWSLAGGGGVLEQAPDATAVISQDFAHSGSWAARLTNQATGTMKEAHLWRDGIFPEEAYYSAWYYLPRTVQTTVDWTIMQFRERATSDPAVVGLHHDIDLRSLPDGQTILTVFDHEPIFLREPTPTPAIPVPIGAWFLLEVFYRHVLDDTGRITVWQDGVLVYDVIGRPTGTNRNVYWTPCTVGYDTKPTAATIYIDDAMISLRRRAGGESAMLAD